ncbi:hypothetical protein DID96_28610 [Burkholderia sp. Bp8963]|nr:hypothetical protein DID96_28610 [Burkholderia sp. Bp8963]
MVLTDSGAGMRRVGSPPREAAGGTDGLKPDAPAPFAANRFDSTGRRKRGWISARCIGRDQVPTPEGWATMRGKGGVARGSP